MRSAIAHSRSLKNSGFLGARGANCVLCKYENARMIRFALQRQTFPNDLMTMVPSSPELLARSRGSVGVP